ncbi:MAG: twin-arginine translocation signal domain-containing protein [Candidatus Moranbacteria bacterium]|nr:twin-arginine translocation signal domain-containing protein [Candidatus Moranbacteria bacterium]
MNFESNLQKSQEPPKMNRREFLKASAALGVLSVVHPEEAMAKLEDVLDYEHVEFGSYEDGIKDLRREVFENEHEVGKFYFKAKKEFEVGFLNKKKVQSGWFEARGIQNSGSVYYIPIKNFEVMFDDISQFEDIRLVHTHPKKSEKIFLEKLGINDIEADENGNFPMAVSSTDVMGVVEMVSEFKYAGFASYEVVEPSGIWRFKVDVNNKNITEIISEGKQAEKNVSEMSEEQKEISRTVIMEIFGENGIEFKAADIPDSIIVKFESESSPKHEELINLINSYQIDILRASKEDRDKVIAEGIRKIGELGINLTYEKF